MRISGGRQEAGSVGRCLARFKGSWNGLCYNPRGQVARQGKQGGFWTHSDSPSRS